MCLGHCVFVIRQWRKKEEPRQESTCVSCVTQADCTRVFEIMAIMALFYWVVLWKVKWVDMKPSQQCQPLFTADLVSRLVPMLISGKKLSFCEVDAGAIPSEHYNWMSHGWDKNRWGWRHYVKEDLKTKEVMRRRCRNSLSHKEHFKISLKCSAGGNQPQQHPPFSPLQWRIARGSC